MIIEKIITDKKLQGTYAYIDKTDPDHNLKQFMADIEKYSLTLNNKCSYELMPLSYWDMSSKWSLSPNPEWLKPLQELVITNNISASQQAMGMFAHYSQ